MAVLKGNAGSFRLTDANTVVEVQSWGLDVSQEYVDTTTFGDTAREQTPTFATWSGSAAAKYDITDAAGQLALQTAWLAGSMVSDLRFYVSAASYYHGDGYVSANIGAAVDGVVEVNYTIAGASALTYHAA